MELQRVQGSGRSPVLKNTCSGYSKGREIVLRPNSKLKAYSTLSGQRRSTGTASLSARYVSGLLCSLVRRAPAHPDRGKLPLLNPDATDRAGHSNQQQALHLQLSDSMYVYLIDLSPGGRERL